MCPKGCCVISWCRAPTIFYLIWQGHLIWDSLAADRVSFSDFGEFLRYQLCHSHWYQSLELQLHPFSCKSGRSGEVDNPFSFDFDTMPPTTSGDGGLPPVPDDEPTPNPIQLPRGQIPKFVPGVTNGQEYSQQKLKFLLRPCGLLNIWIS